VAKRVVAFRDKVSQLTRGERESEPNAITGERKLKKLGTERDFYSLYFTEPVDASRPEEHLKEGR